MKYILLVCLLGCGLYSATGKTDTTYDLRFYPDTFKSAVYVWETEAGKPKIFSAYDTSMNLIYHFDLQKKVLHTYHRFMGEMIDDALRDSISHHYIEAYGIERSDYLRQFRITDTVKSYLWSVNAFKNYRHIAFVKDRGGNSFVNELVYKDVNRPPSKYTHYYNGKKVVSAKFILGDLGFAVKYRYKYNKDFDILILTDSRTSPGIKQISFIYTLLPSFLILVLYIIMGYIISRRYYSWFYVFSTLLVLGFPFVLISMTFSARDEPSNILSIMWWFYIGMVIVSVVLTFHNLMKEKTGKALRVWSGFFLLLVFLGFWLVYELAHMSWKVGG